MNNLGSKDFMKKVFVKDITDGYSVSEIFLAKKKIKGVSRNGNSYLTVILADRTGEIEGKVWDKALEFDQVFDANDFVKIEGKASLYQGRPQITILDVSWIEKDKISLEDFLKSSEKDPAVLLEELKEIYKKISDKFLKKLVFAFLDDEQFVKEFAKSPAASGVHHAYIGGLLEHVLSMAHLAGKVASHYASINLDLLLTGVFFHDIGKTRELTIGNSFEYTDEGRLLGHLMIGCEMIEEKISKIKGFPDNLRLLVKHLTISHHGSLEFGSPKLPQTIEALILHYIDDIDAKMNIASGMMKESGAKWTEFNKYLNRNLFKGDTGTKEKEMPETEKQTGETRKKPQTELDLFEK